jgi:adenylyltransferase/sulfurtransferase
VPSPSAEEWRVQNFEFEFECVLAPNATSSSCRFISASFFVVPPWDFSAELATQPLLEALNTAIMADTLETNGSSQTAELESSHRIRDLEAKLQSLEEENRQLRLGRAVAPSVDLPQVPTSPLDPVHELSRDQIERYSRQLLLQEGFGVAGQRKLLSSSVLVVGAGGIGSTVLLYLGASGIGRIGVVDFDEVETSNLHRQVIHSSQNVGVNKAVSACRAVLDLNPTIQCHAIPSALTHDNALDLIQQYDCVVDASDNPKTRYLINDACVLANKPLVSGSAIGTEGQLTVYNWQGGPCYRCLYPKPSASAGCGSCSDNGVLGPVPGLVGVLQAVETMKILTGMGATMHDRLLMYDSLQCSFLSVKKPKKQPKCPVCGPEAIILSMEDSRNSLQAARGPTGLVDNGKSISLKVPTPTLPDELTVTCQEYSKIRSEGLPHVLLDVRAEKQYEMCALDGAVNIPLARLQDELDEIERLSDGTIPVYCICRRGVFSVEATSILRRAQTQHPLINSVTNIAGGLTAWHEEVDESFPKY